MPHDDEDDKENEDMEDPDTRLHSEHSSTSAEESFKPLHPQLSTVDRRTGTERHRAFGFGR